MGNGNCVFCKIVEKEFSSDFVDESDNFLAVLDIHPKSPGHTLIISKKHFENFMELPNVLASELFLLAKKIAHKRFGEGNDGFNFSTNNGKSAGQVVDHLHFHLIPRKSGDKIN